MQNQIAKLSGKLRITAGLLWTQAWDPCTVATLTQARDPCTVTTHTQAWDHCTATTHT